MPPSERFRESQSRMLTGETKARSPPWVSWIEISRSGSAKGRGRKRVASTRAKMALLAPMPRARVATAISVKAGAPRSCRSANFTS